MAKGIRCMLLLHGCCKEINIGTFESKRAAKKYVSECWDRPYTIVPVMKFVK